MSISAALVKQLRERTSSSIMDCKRALVEAAGDLDKAAENLRKSGMAKADKKADRIAADGRIAVAGNEQGIVILELNSETDFVAKNESFVAFSDQLAQLVLTHDPADVAALNALPCAEGTVDSGRQELVARLGEKCSIRRFERLSAEDSIVASYQHGARIGVVVKMQGGDADLARDVAMHIAASKPLCVSADQLPADAVAKERDIYLAQAADSGKPAAILEKIVDGKLAKYMRENTLEGQSFIKDPDTRVGQMLKKAAATVQSFVRYEVGEGIEKAEDDFAAEVRAQAGL